MTQLAHSIQPAAPLQSTPRAISFFVYWGKYRTEIHDIAARARRIALKDGRDVVCLNDCQAAWTQIVGPMWVD